MQRQFPLVVLASSLILILLLGCASGPEREPGAGALARSDPNRLSSEEIRGFPTAAQAVQGLRSGWLRLRSPAGINSAGQVWVYQDGMRLGGVEVMTNLSTAEIEMIEYVDGIRASQRWGLGHENGVINVISRTR
jgi:hypothetical protein